MPSLSLLLLVTICQPRFHEKTNTEAVTTWPRSSSKSAVTLLGSNPLLSPEGKKVCLHLSCTTQCLRLTSGQSLGSLLLADLEMAVQYSAVRPDSPCSPIPPMPVSNSATCLHSCACTARALSLSDSLPPSSPPLH